jgi:hypothetical protein
MNQPRDPDAIIATWLDDGPIDLPDETRRAIAVGLRTQPRVRRVAILGGSSMLALNRLAAAAAIVLAVGALTAVLVMSSARTGPSGARTPTSSQAASPTPFTSPTVFTSPTYRYSATLPAGWLVIPAQRSWDGSLAAGYDDPSVDQWVAPSVQNRCTQVFLCAPTLWALSGPTTLDLAAWVATQDAAGLRDHQCTIPHAAAPISIDGHDATLEDGHCGTDGPLLLGAYVVRNGTGYAFMLQDTAREGAVETLDRSEFTDLLSTVRLQP